MNKTDIFKKLEICAKAVGYDVQGKRNIDGHLWVQRGGLWYWYDPYQNDAQAFELIQGLGLEIHPSANMSHWSVYSRIGNLTMTSAFLATAIIDCVSLAYDDK